MLLATGSAFCWEKHPMIQDYEHGHLHQENVKAEDQGRAGKQKHKNKVCSPGHTAGEAGRHLKTPSS